MSKRAALVSAVVAAALVAAIFGATAALRMISGGAFGPGGRPLSEADVRRMFDAAPGTPAVSPSPTGPGQSRPQSPGPSRTPGGRSGVFSSAGGAVYASCASGKATLSRWIPAGGYATDGYLQGPARSASVKFKSGGSEVIVTITCVSGMPHFAASADNGSGEPGDDGGHRGGRAGGGGGGGH